MSSLLADGAAAHPARAARFAPGTLKPAVCCAIALFLHLAVPKSDRYMFTVPVYHTVFLALCLAAALAGTAVSLLNSRWRQKYLHQSTYLGAVFLALAVYDLATLKLMWLPSIYFPAPDRILQVFVEDGAFLFKCMAYSLRLLAVGFLSGALVGMVTGVLVGWSKQWSYWVDPLIKIIGPIPSTAWIPIALVVFPSSFHASVFLIALSVWFPTTVLTSSGIANVKNAYFEVSSTLGATNVQKVLRVAVPAAMPSIFVGLFNGLCASFLTLMTAEMLGVKYGIGWYINWQREMLSYANVYAALMLIAVTFYLLITLLFRLRDRMLLWQKGVIKW